MELKALLVMTMLFCAFIVPATAIDDKTTYNVVYTGSTAIKAALAAKTQPAADIIKVAIETELTKESFPLYLKATNTDFTIDKYRCTLEKCGYWITATRNKQEVAINNPVWLVNGNFPFHTLVSQSEDTKANTVTITVKEDIKGAIWQILSEYVDRQPLGKSVMGTKS